MRQDLNLRPRPYKDHALPLSYASILGAAGPDFADPCASYLRARLPRRNLFFVDKIVVDQALAEFMILLADLLKHFQFGFHGILLWGLWVWRTKRI